MGRRHRGGTGVLCSVLVALVAAIVTCSVAAADGSSPIVTGDSRDGGYLRCQPSADPSVRAVGMRVVWLRDGQPVDGAVVPTFPLVDDDVGHAISCAIDGGAAAAPVLVSPILPAFGGLPTAQTDSIEGTPIRCSANVVAGAPAPAVSYAWLVDGVPTGVDGDTFAPLPSTPSSSVACRVTLTNAAGSVSATSVGISRRLVVVRYTPGAPASARTAARLRLAPPYSPVPDTYIEPWRRLDERGRLPIDIACAYPHRQSCRLRLVLRGAPRGSGAPEVLARAVVEVSVLAEKTIRLQLRPGALASARESSLLVASLTTSFADGPGRATVNAVAAATSLDAGLGWARGLPGFPSRPGPGVVASLSRSAVVILSRPHGTYGSWSADCTGTKVTTGAGDDPLVLTAAHCFRTVVQSVFGTALSTYAPVGQIDDYVGLGGMDFAIADASATRTSRESSPVAIVDGIAVHPEGKTDIALLHARPEYPDIAVVGRRYDAIPAIAYRPVAKPPAIGSPVVADSAPELTRRQTRALGRYAGRLSDGLRTFDAVVVAPDRLLDDPCYYGASGSLGVTGTGQLMGPLSERAADGYPAGVPSPIDQPWFKIEWSQRLAQAVGVSPADFDLDTVCLYGTPKPGEIEATGAAFGRYP